MSPLRLARGVRGHPRLQRGGRHRPGAGPHLRRRRLRLRGARRRRPRGGHHRSRSLRALREESEPRLRPVVNTYGRGPANAIRFGIDQAAGQVVVVTMADGSDDPRQIDALARLVERGVVVAAASRYTAGGQQVGGPMLKGLLSRGAGRSLGLLARVGTQDATNSFKAYSTEFVREVGIDSRSGFEIGLELTAKARRLRRPGGRDLHDLAGPHGRGVELRPEGLDPQVPPLVPVRLRSELTLDEVRRQSSASPP